MNVADFLQLLQELKIPSNTTICAFDGDTKIHLPVTGVLFYPEDEPPRIELQTDDTD